MTSETFEFSFTPNPLLDEFITPYQTPPFHLIKPEHFLPAFIDTIKEALNEISVITGQNAEPDFANTMESLSRSGSRLARISNIFFALNSAETNPLMQEIAREVAPLLADYQNDVLFNTSLFSRIREVYNKQNSWALTPEEASLMDKTYKMFVREGANLGESDQERLREISRRLSELSLRFEDNLLAETNNWILHLTDPEDLAGLPSSQKEAAAEEAHNRGLQGWVITLKAPSYWPFMQYAERRHLREKLFKAANQRAFRSNPFDNREIIMQLANLRLERAGILGYKSHAHYVLVESMAMTVEKVEEFLRRLYHAFMPVAQKELAHLQAFAAEAGADFALKPWDWHYFEEKLRKASFDFDKEELRPYFKLDDVVHGVFTLTGRLWGLKYIRNHTIPVYHAENQVYEVYGKDDDFLAILYLDFFPREGKNQGAWMTVFRDQERRGGKNIRPQVSLVCNFARPTTTKPSLLTHEEFNTFLHEFGHALHGIFSQVTYANLSGTNVYRDFVELPSQIMENWAVEEDFLNLFARHYQTGEVMPSGLIKKIVEARNFHAGFAAVRQLGFAFLDMAWHSVTEPIVESVVAFEQEALKTVRLFPPVENTLISTTFAHIFAGRYASGYYSYKWAEVLDADAYEVFKSNGVFDSDTAESFREHILSKGGTEHPMDLFKRFRGREPAIEALLEREGLR